MGEVREFRLLLLGGGKRNSLVRSFRSASIQDGIGFSCLAYESNINVPVTLEADVLVGLPWNSDGIVDNLCELVVDQKIDWVCACVDQATQFLEQISKRVLPNLLTSSKDACLCMMNKEVADDIALSAGLAPIPRCYIPPLFVKPKSGSASRDSRLVNTEAELDSLTSVRDRSVFMFQIACEGPEYTVDCFADRNLIHASPRVRIQTSGGEATVSRTVDRQDLVDMANSFICAAGLLGPLTIQFIEHKGEVFFMECNPRFGGGVVCSIERGFNFPLSCIRASFLQAPPVFLKKANIEMSRYFSEAYFEVGD